MGNMKSFDVEFNVIKKIIDNIPTSQGFGVYTELDVTSGFINRLNKFLNKDISYFSGTPPESFPQLARVSLSLFTANDKEKLLSQAGAMEFDRELSEIKAKGEFLERISSRLPFDIARKVDFDRAQVLKNAEPFVFARRVLGFGLEKVNSSDVYYNLNNVNLNKEDGKIKRQITSNGGAGHFDYKKSVLGGWLELVQRDAFLVHWLNSISPAKIDVDEHANKNENFRKMLSMIKNYNLECYFLDITSDLPVPSCVCVMVADSPTGKRISIGASSGFDAEKIIKNAFTEAVSVISSVYYKEPYILAEDYEPFSKVEIDRDNRLRIYTTNDMFEKFKFFISSSESISIENFISLNKTINVSKDSEKEQLNYLKKIFKEKYKNDKGYDVLVYEIKNKLLDEFDYRVVKVMCNALYSIYLNENFADPNHPRLKEFVKCKGLESVAKLNIWPHPFP